MLKIIIRGMKKIPIRRYMSFCGVTLEKTFQGLDLGSTVI
jgi:hypothetical protein